MQLRKFRTRLVQVGIAVCSVVAMVAFQNCSNKNFGASAIPSNNNSQGNPNVDGNGIIPLAPPTPPYNCVSVLQNSTFPAKLIFIVDVSGSNASNGNQPGTDPMKNYRGGSIQSFYNTFVSKANFHWGFSTFSGNSARALIGTPIGTTAVLNPTVSANPSDMQNAITTFNTVNDNGSTPYREAIAQAKATIMNDNPSSPANATTKYMIVFMSDGLPNPDRSETELAGYVTDALSAAPGKVSFNTIYYGTLDNDAGNRMYKMAQVGGGQFLDVNLNPQGKSFPISNVIQVPGVTCPTQ